MVQVLGVDMWEGQPSELNTFRLLTGTTYPLLWDGQNPPDDLDVLYGPYDNYIVIDMRDTTVVYHAALIWPHGERYHLDEIRSAVDGILATVDAPRPGPVRRPLRVAPNPVRDYLRVEFSNPAATAAEARLTLYDAAGRALSTLFAGRAAPGEGRWEGSLAERLGGTPRPGVYFLRLEMRGETAVQRFVVLPE